MSVFSTITNWLFDGLRRSKGVQLPAPATYSEEAASSVTFDSAMQISGVWACVKLIAETVASLPITIYENTESGRVVADRHPLNLLFAGKVNRYQTRVEFFETVLLNLVMHGNAYCLIQRRGGRIVGLLPLMTAQVETVLLDDGSVVHEYFHDSGVDVLADSSVWHLKLMGNGIIGLSPLAHQRNTLGIAQAAESAVTKIYRNGAKPSGVLSMDRVLTPQQRQQVRDSFASLTTNTDDRLMVLEGGMKFDAVSMSPQDIELLSSRKYQLAEICRWYGVPSVMINDTSATTVWGSGIEQIVSGFYKLTLRPLLEKIEDSIVVNLINEPAKNYEAEFSFEAILRADQKSRYDGYRIGIQGAIITPNEARALEGLPMMEGGDQLFIQGATVPLVNQGIEKPLYNQSTERAGNEDTAQIT